MRIGIICYPTYGGSGVVATELGRHLALRGHQVHILSFDRPFRIGNAPYQDNLFFHEITSVNYPVLRSELYTLSAAVKIAQVAEEVELDIIHSHYAVPHAVSAMLAAQMLPEGRLRTVCTLHGTDTTLVGSHPAFQPAVRLGIVESDAVVAVSQWLAEETRRRFALTEADPPVRVIYNFVDPEKFKRTSHACCLRSWFAPPDEKLVLHISNFRPVKRALDVVETFARIARELPSTLVMVGDGPERDAVARRVRELELTERVRMLGLQSDIEPLLGMADLFLFPSEYESFGLAALEAMSSETPVVCSDGGGLPEVVADGETGYLCPVGDVDAMAERSLEILRDPDRGRAMGEAGRQRTIDCFHPERALREHEKLYESLIGRA